MTQSITPFQRVILLCLVLLFAGYTERSYAPDPPKETERFNHALAVPELQELLTKASQLARQLNHPMVDTIHLLLAMAKTPGICTALFTDVGTDAATVAGLIDKNFPSVTRIEVSPEDDGEPVKKPIGTPRSKALNDLLVEAQKAATTGTTEVGNVFEQFLKTAGAPAGVLADAGVELKRFDHGVVKPELRPSIRVKPKNVATVDNSRNLTAEYLDLLLRGQELPAILDRGNELDTIKRILIKPKKNNATLLGDAGVGKTAIMEAFAQELAYNQLPKDDIRWIDLPEQLAGKQFRMLDLAALVAGTKNRGDFELRITTLLAQIKKSGDTVLGIDEMHNLMGAGGAEGAMDAANLLKPALARGDLQSISATTLSEYRKYIEKDDALARRFQPFTVEQPSVEGTVRILRRMREALEIHFGVTISDDALERIPLMARKFMGSKRRDPDVSIDLLEETCAMVSLNARGPSSMLRELTNRKGNLDDRISALLRESLDDELEPGSANITAANRLKIDDLRKESHAIQDQMSDLQLKWNTVVTLRKEIGEIDSRLRNINFDDSNSGGEDGDRARLRDARRELRRVVEESPILSTTVDVVQVAIAIEKRTGIPAGAMSADQFERLLRFEDEIGKHIVSQNAAKTALGNIVRMAGAGMNNPKKPLGSALFLGPPGTGKTALAEALAEFLFGDKAALIELNMQEFSTEHTISSLIGSAPGLVQSDQGGRLTNAVLDRPYSVVLLDEIDLAHPSIARLLYGVLNKGFLTDAMGRKVDFRNTIIIATSNKTRQEIAHFFGPALMDRIEEITDFHNLTNEELVKAVDVQFRLVKEISKLQGFDLDLTHEAKLNLVERAKRTGDGSVRQVEEAIRNSVRGPLATASLREGGLRGATIVAHVDGDDLVFSGTNCDEALQAVVAKIKAPPMPAHAEVKPNITDGLTPESLFGDMGDFGGFGGGTPPRPKPRGLPKRR